MSTATSSNRTEWLAKRRKGLGASDAPTVVGVRKEPSRFRLWLEKRGEVEPDEPNEAMRMGLAAEWAIAEMFTERTGWGFTRTQIHYVHPDVPWAMATIDGQLDELDFVEFKLAGTWTTRKLPEDGDAAGLPEPWIIQAHHQMWVTSATSIQFAVWCADPSFRLYRVDRDESLIAEMIRLEEAFWRQVQEGTPPAEFGADDLGAITRHFNREEPEAVQLDPYQVGGAVADFAAAQKEIKIMEATRDEAKAALLMAMGNATHATCGAYSLKRKVVNVKADPNPKPREASSYVRFTCTQKEESNAD